MSETVWKGAESLRPFLVAIDELEPFKGNPRRGDVEALRASLRRWGQIRPILTYETSRIVAGHHIVLAAQEEEWTHVAALAHEFTDDGEARDFLLADNRLHDLGRYEDDLLLAQLQAARDLAGTGYTDADRKRLEEDLARVFAETSEPPPRLDERSENGKPQGFEVRIYLGRDERRDFANWIKLLQREWGQEGTTSVIVRAVREAALAANS